MKNVQSLKYLNVGNFEHYKQNQGTDTPDTLQH